MAYSDPFAGRYDQQYTDGPGFNPYNNTQPHQAYDQGGYDTYGAGGYREDASHEQPTNPGGSAFAPGHQKSESIAQYDQGAFARATTAKRPQSVGHWRYENRGRGDLWTKGGRGATIGRFCCCALMIIVFIIISILLSLALWTRPPNIMIGNIQPVLNGSEIQLTSNSVQINLDIPVYVSNPNYFSASFASIEMKIYYPIDNTRIGQGRLNDVTFHSHSNSSITFPLLIEFSTTMPSSSQIISDLQSKCGTEGGTVSDITVKYDITLALRVFFITVSPTFSDSVSFKCPLTASDLSNLTSGLAGGN